MVFNWLVDKINVTIAPPSISSWGKKFHFKCILLFLKLFNCIYSGFIGVLDIYGFENFDNLNSFEQLLINYANEKLQNHFNKHIFQLEQVEYESEGIDWSYINFQDNSPCVELIDGKPSGKSGIFQTLDDCVSSGRSNNEINASFLAQLNTTLSGSNTNKHSNFLSPRFNSDQRFGVLHYAGEVYYEIQGFVEKNKDSTNIDMKELMSKSNNVLLRNMAEETIKFSESSISVSSFSSSTNLLGTSSSKKNNVSGVSPRGSVSKLKEDSISKQFTISLKQLYDTLDKTDPHYIRCLKPNAFKLPNKLNIREIMLQLKYAGMMEAIRIRQLGYSSRQLHEHFFKKYSILLPQSTTLKELFNNISAILDVHEESW